MLCGAKMKAEDEWTKSLSELSEGGGNAKTPPSKRKQTCYWKCNYHIKEGETHKEIAEQIEQAFKSYMPLDEYIFGEEYGASGKTPHLECYLKFKTKKEFHKIMEVFKWSDLRASKKAWFKAGVTYCSKECNRIWTNMKVPKPLALMTYDHLNEEQKQIANMFKGDEDPLFGRKIYWFWESKGGWGKSKTATYMIDNMDAVEVSGKGADVFCGISQLIELQGGCPPIIIWDVPRSINQEYISYQAIEKIKDGKFFSPKYESGMRRFNRPHIICFANEPPQIDKLSEDRWEIVKLIKCDCSLGKKDDQFCPVCGT